MFQDSITAGWLTLGNRRRTGVRLTLSGGRQNPGSAQVAH